MTSHRLENAGVRLRKTVFVLIITTAFGPQTFAQSLETITIEGKALDEQSVSKPYSLLPNATFIQKPGATLAEKINQTPGVAESAYSPGASRPVIRGQDSERIKIMRNSSSSVDVSSLSPDHGIPIDPLTIQQVEITRGPEALAYGGNAIGGAVNLIDERIARTSSDSFLGEFTSELFGAANSRAFGIKLMSPTVQGLNLRVDAFDRKQDDLRTPDFTDPNGNRVSRISNSSLSSQGGGVGISHVSEDGYVGISAETFKSDYGLPQTEPTETIRIGLVQDRYALEGQYRLAGLGQEVRYRLSKTDYSHQELEDGEPATRFSNEGINGRLDWFNRLGRMGLQFENADFSAVGEEAFVPPSETDTIGLYYLGGTAFQSINIEYGLRVDSTRIQAEKTGINGVSGPIQPGVGFVDSPFNRQFNSTSLSVGANWAMSDQWRVGTSLSHSERAPSSFELLADGLHVATFAYEKGNPDLSVERSTHMEISNTWQKGQSNLSANLFYTRFPNYIGQFQRGGGDSTTVIDGEPVPVYDFQQVRARFYGLEVQASTEYRWGPWQNTPRLTADWVNAKRSDTDENIPRQTPVRIKASLAMERLGWVVTPELVATSASKPGLDETRTPGHTLINLSVSKAVSFGNIAGQAYLNAVNLTDKLAYNANTFETVRYFTPKSGRSVHVGLKLLF